MPGESVNQPIKQSTACDICLSGGRCFVYETRAGCGDTPAGLQSFELQRARGVRLSQGRRVSCSQE